MVFFAALGIPLVLSSPIGSHERYNRRWVLERGAGIRQPDPGRAGWRLVERIEDGTLATMAWSGYTRLPSDGLYRILDIVGHPAGPSDSHDRPGPDPMGP
jgi:hypothetical protein